MASDFPTCPDCDTSMDEANDMASEKAKWICPNCSPDFVYEGATV